VRDGTKITEPQSIADSTSRLRTLLIIILINVNKLHRWQTNTWYPTKKLSTNVTKLLTFRKYIRLSSRNHNPDNLSNHQFTQEILKQHITQFSHYFSVLAQANFVSIVITNQGSLSHLFINLS
jgi:hypothetical protein